MRKDDCCRSYGLGDAWRGPMDVWNMFVGYELYSGEIADTFLGSFTGTYELTNIDCDKKTANLKFHLSNTTGWNSATRIPGTGGGSIVPDSHGPVYDEDISWEEKIAF